MRIQQTGILVILLLFFLGAKAQNYSNYPDAFVTPSHPKYIDTFTVNMDTVVNFYKDTFILKLKFSVPENDGLHFAKRPLMLGIHGGAFLSDYSGGFAYNAYQNTSTTLENTFAAMGWITASLDYRTGYGLKEEQAMLDALNNPNSAYCDALTPTLMKQFTMAACTATFDCRKAIDFIFNDTALLKFIDTSQVYLFGSSAGAITAMHTIFSETDEFFESPVDMPAMAQRHKLAGVIAYAGAMADGYTGNVLHHIDTGEGVPIFMAHGMQDNSVPYNTGYIAQCSKTNQWHGSAAIADKLCSLQLPFELYLIDSAGHNVRVQSSTITFRACLQFIKNRGLCPQPLSSSNNYYKLNGDLLRKELCKDLK